MQDMKIQVNDAIVALGFNAHFFYPQSKTDWDKLPVVCFREVNNPEQHHADNVEISQRSVMQIDVYAKTGAEVMAAGQQINDALKALGYTREYAADLKPDASRLRHRVLRFSGVFYN